MKDNKVARLMRAAALFRQQFAQEIGGICSWVLGEAEIAAIVNTYVKKSRVRIYSPLDTLRLFVGQVLCERACQDAVGRRLSERVAHGQSQNTLNTGAYCQARARLPIEVPLQLGAKIGQRLEVAAPRAWRWRDRVVKLFDGTTVSMPDTLSNQQAFPPSEEQQPGLGFPIARIGALIGLAGGGVLGHQVTACKGKGSGEQSLLRALLPLIQPRDVVLADALLASWWMIADVLARGGDVVMPQHGRRITDFTRGQRFGKHDHLVAWARPPRPRSMPIERYDRYPQWLRMREVKVHGRILVSSLREPKMVSAHALAALYALRWSIEVDFRTIKATLKMDVLRCKTEAMIEKEIAVHLLAYNLVRWSMATSARLADVLPRALSFSGAQCILNAFSDQLRHSVEESLSCLVRTVLTNIAKLKLPFRPGRIEPRAKKRRPKPLPLLTVPRNVARELIRTRRDLIQVP